MIECHHCENCTPWPWSTFSRSTIWNVNMLKTVRGNAVMLSDDVCTFLCLPSNGTITNFVSCNVELYISSRSTLEMLRYWKRRVSAKQRLMMTFINVYILNQMTPLRMVQSLTWAFISRSKCKWSRLSAQIFLFYSRRRLALVMFRFYILLLDHRHRRRDAKWYSRLRFLARRVVVIFSMAGVQIKVEN